MVGQGGGTPKRMAFRVPKKRTLYTGASTERSVRRRGTGIGEILSLWAGKGDNLQIRAGTEGDSNVPVATPRLRDLTVATRRDARRNLATETLRMRSAGSLRPGARPAP